VAEPVIDIRKVVTGRGADTVTSSVADVTLTDVTQLRTGFADNKFGDNIVADTSTIAAENGAVFAINGDDYGYRRSGIEIRNGVTFRDDGARQGLAIYRDGTMALYDERATDAGALLADGVWTTLSCGPGLVTDGEVIAGIGDVEVDTNIGNHSIRATNPAPSSATCRPRAASATP
jgi:exopolysaccharide biosynthesis protein